MGNRLTDQTARAMPAPPSGNRVQYDTEVPGFGLRTTAAGAKSFVLNYRVDGRERRITIGSWPAWTAGAARERAKALRREVDTGLDPLARRETARQAPTVAALAERYLAEHAATKKRASSAAEDASMMRQHIIPRLGNLRVDAVRRGDIEAMHSAISRSTPTRGNRVVALASKMFSLAVAWEWRSDNPCRVEKNQENRRERYLTAAELERLMKALGEYPSLHSSANAVRLLLLTGSRRGEVLAADWNQFDLEAGVWTKPAIATKQKKSHRIPLSAPARQLLVEMQAKAEGEALFPGRGDREHQQTLKTFWAAVCEKARLRDFRLHDLRHSHASILASGGQSLLVIGQLLGHSNPATTARYAHLFDDVQRRAVETVGAIVAAAGSDDGGVTPLRRRRA